MLQNFLKIALRNLLKRKVYSFINIAGLAFGLACFLLIALFINHELSYEQWNPNADRIIRPVSDIKFGGINMQMAVIGSPIGPDMKQDLPEVQSFCRFRDYGGSLVRKDSAFQQNVEEQHILTVDSSFFELFPLELLAGDRRTCLTRPNTIALSQSRAERYFSSPQAALGNTLILDNDRRYEVTAVFEDMPANTHFDADLLISMNGNQEVANDPKLWATNNNFHTYLLLEDHVQFEDFAAKFKVYSSEKISETVQQVLNISLAEFEQTGQYARFELQRLPDIHLRSDLGGELAPNGSIQYVWIFGAIALFVLFVACINFVNLTTARSSQRAREIGVRKALGSLRSTLIAQFYSETILMTGFAVVLAVGIVAAAIPWFRELTLREMSIPWASPAFWIALVGGIGVVGLLAGSYPALFLSAFDTIRSLKGGGSAKAGHGNLRSGLVVFQFVTSIVLIISTILIYNQLNFIQNKNLGFQKDQVIIIENTYALDNQVEVYKQQLLQQPEVQSVTVSSFLPVPSSRSNSTFSTTREFRQDNTINMAIWEVDTDYLETIGLSMASGRFFDEALLTDSSAIILNETAVGILGFDQPLGEKIYYPDNFTGGQPGPEDFREFTIVGVLEDFHWESLRENIGPLAMQLGTSTGLMSVRYDAVESRTVLSKLETYWNQLAPEQPFSYRFMDESFANMYQSEQRFGTIASSFSVLAILISFLGLFGLTSYTIDQRLKEIGIRKVLGATPANIVSLLSRDYLKLAGIGLIIAIPIAWWGMDQWLQGFAFRISIAWWVFLLAGMAALLTVLLSVSFQSLKVAVGNPMDSLKSD